jgi:adenylate cyclase
LGTATGIVGLLISALPFGQNLEENVGLDWLFKLRGVRQPPPEVVVVSIDKASTDALDLPNKPRKWPRYKHALLIKKLIEAGARVIAFDIIFDEPRSPEDDTAFAKAVSEAGNVVLFEYLKKESVPISDRAGTPTGELAIERLVPPIPQLARSAVALAPFPLPDLPVKVSQVWTFKTGAGDVPTMPVIVFQIFALSAYDQLLTLLRAVSPTHAAKLPRDRKTVLRTKGVEALSRNLRTILKNNPIVAHKMLDALEGQHVVNLDIRTKRILRSLVRMYQGGHSHYLNYYGPARSITTVPYHEVLRATDELLGEGTPVSLRDKAVFVGFSARLQPEQKDDFYTVFTSQSSGLHISGVEIAATAFANLLEDMPVKRLGPLALLSAVLLWGLLIGGICRFVPVVVGVVATLALSMLYLTLVHYQFKTSGIWLPVVIPLIFQAPFAAFVGVFWRYVDTNKERRNIRRAFGYYLPDKVVDQLAENVSDIRAKNQLVYGTCLSTDAEQYTSLAERVDPKQLGAMMNTYYEAVFQPVKQHGGIVSDVIGDSMMAIWATSNPDNELRTQACLAALDIAGAVERFNQSSDSLELPTRIGLHSGQMLLGSIGAVDHYEFRAVGDIVNTSTRIEGLNKQLGTRILVSEEVLEGLDGFLSRAVGKFLLVGKSKPVVLHELICRIQDSDETRMRLCTAFTSALAPFRMQRWEEARSRFLRLLQEHGQDGPSRFYLERCDSYSKDPSTAPRDGVISVATK